MPTKVVVGDEKTPMCVFKKDCDLLSLEKIKIAAGITNDDSKDQAIQDLLKNSKGGGKKTTKKPAQQRVYYNKSTRASLVHLEEGTKRKYIKVGGKPIYLDTIRGKYKLAK